VTNYASAEISRCDYCDVESSLYDAFTEALRCTTVDVVLLVSPVVD